MNRENPVYDKSFITKEPGNKLRISKSAYKAWLPMFYCIPREIVQQRPIYLQLPRCPYEILRTDKYDKIVNDDAFLETIWDAYALCIWQYLPIPDKDEGAQADDGKHLQLLRQFPTVARVVHDSGTHQGKAGKRRHLHAAKAVLSYAGHGDCMGFS